ncbi:hypothetical protein VTN02DRAFT_4335 [Thermoascus thermophilus]
MAKPMTPELVRDLVSRLDPSTKVVTRDQPEYETAIARWSQASVKAAGAVAFPRAAEEVSKIVVFASQHQVDLAVKCGGHATGGTNSSDGGLVIDLGGMRAVTVDARKKIITAQGGALWEDVNKAAAQHGLATVGATVDKVGIGGLTLGGGFGWLSGQYGAVIDNLVRATVVLASGQIVEASEQDNSDLFWAIRGAGHNFGVVVEFQYAAHEQPNNVFAGTLTFAPDKLDALINVFNQRHWSPNPRAAFHCTFVKPPETGPVVAVTLFYNGDESQARTHFASILNLGPTTSTVSSMPYPQANEMIKDAPGGRKSLKGATFNPPIRNEFAQWLWQEFTSKVTQDPDLGRTTISIEFYDMTRVAGVPVKKTAFPTRGFFQTGIIKLRWTDPGKDDEVRAWGRCLQAKCREEIKENITVQPQSGALLEYANYSEPDDLQFTAPFGPNQKTLAQLKAKYDPSCLFNKTNPITPEPA